MSDPDREELLKPFLEREMRFIVRRVGNRHLVARGPLAGGRRLSFAVEGGGNETIHFIKQSLNMESLRVLNYDPTIVRGAGEE